MPAVQVFINLVWNALKFTAKGFVHLRATCAAEEANGKREVLFEVIDSGIGISKEDQKLVFEVGRRAATA